jgi:hypothetical protein
VECAELKKVMSEMQNELENHFKLLSHKIAAVSSTSKKKGVSALDMFKKEANYTLNEGKFIRIILLFRGVLQYADEEIRRWFCGINRSKKRGILGESGGRANENELRKHPRESSVDSSKE